MVKDERLSNFQSSRIDAITKEEHHLREVIAHSNSSHQSLTEQLRALEAVVRS